MSLKPDPPQSKVGKSVWFSPPVAVGHLPPRTGKIEQEVWSDVYEDSDWGWYIYTSQLIKWDQDGSKSIRLTYYYHPGGGSKWFFGGQYSIEDSPAVIKDILEKTLAMKWC